MYRQHRIVIVGDAILQVPLHIDLALVQRLNGRATVFGNQEMGRSGGGGPTNRVLITILSPSPISRANHEAIVGIIRVALPLTCFRFH